MVKLTNVCHHKGFRLIRPLNVGSKILLSEKGGTDRVSRWSTEIQIEAVGQLGSAFTTKVSLMKKLSGGLNPPPTEPGSLTRGRRITAMGCLVLFIVLFMPTPLREGDPPQLVPWMSEAAERAVDAAMR